MEELWGISPPRTAVTTAQTYIYQLRKKYRTGDTELILTKAPGYLLRLDEGQLDIQEFERLHVEGTRLLADGHPERASDRLRQGMNTGMQDAYNLAWKLADVVRRHAEPRLLDSYDVERVPIGAALLRSTRTATALVALRTALAPVLLPAGLSLLRLLWPVRRKVEGKMIRGFCGLGLAYPDSPLSLPPVSSAGIRPGGRVGCDAESMRAHLGWAELCAELTDPRWTLLVTVPTGTNELVREFRDTAESAARRFAAAVSVRVVDAPVAESVAESSCPRSLADPDGGLRRSLGLAPGEFLLIRPDGYVAAHDRGPDRFETVLRACCLVPAVARSEGSSDAHR